MLGKFRENHRPTDVKKEDYVERVICFARALGGDEGTKVFDFIKIDCSGIGLGLSLCLG